MEKKKKYEFGEHSPGDAFYAPIYEAIENGAVIDESWVEPKTHFSPYDLIQKELHKMKMMKEMIQNKGQSISAVDLLRKMSKKRVNYENYKRINNRERH